MTTYLARRVTLFLCAAFFFSPLASPQSEAPSADQQNGPTFKAETNLVLVPVVVRDAQGNAIGDLRKEDFQVFDKGKPRTIVSFAVQESTRQTPPNRGVGGADQPSAAPAIPEHFVALLFDDLHMEEGPGTASEFAGATPESPAGDLFYSRNAALKFLDTLQPADRVALYTASGEQMVDFTSDRAKLKDALWKVRQALRGESALSACGVQSVIERESRVTVTMAAAVARRMALLPGQRTMVVISPGLFLSSAGACPWSLLTETMQLVDRALRSHIVINGLDARGLAVNRAHVLHGFQEQLAYGTGGRFITDTNDLPGALQRLAATPNYIYVLGYSPDPLKPDGSFHAIEVKLDRRHVDIQARQGYWAPDEKELARAKSTPPAVENLPQLDEKQTNDVAQAIGVASAPAKPAPLPEVAVVAAAAAEPPKLSPPTAPASQEISTRDEPVTFKVQANLVEVPVVVRDRQGHAVGNLHKEDFRIFDKGKRQEIAKFSLQAGTAAPGLGNTQEPKAQNAAAPNVPPVASAPPVPNRFVAFLFDDLHVRFADLPQVRAAVLKYIRTSLQPLDRVALYTASGRVSVDFTDRPEQLGEALLKIAPRPIRAQDNGPCGDAYVSYFQAVQVDQQVGLSPQMQDVAKSLPLRVAVEEIGDFHTAVQNIRDAYTTGVQESRAVLSALKIIVQRMAAAPGQRSVVLVSPGFFVPADLQNQNSDLMSLAIRSKVLIGSVDARGVWTVPVYDACHTGNNAAVIQDETAFGQLDNDAATDELIALAEGTGGAVNLDNDFDGGVRKAAAAPEYLYLLAFAPPNLKADGSFHPLKVALNSGERLTLQARRGYWAPKQVQDADAAVKQEIEDAIFSRDEIHNLPVEMHTQVTQSGGEAKLNVLTSVDLKLLHLRRVDGRNRDDVTIVAAVFDSNGNFIAGTQKVLQLRLRDETVQQLHEKPPVTIDTNFEMKPGTYLVRLVARDGEGQEITAENAGVQIPDPPSGK